MWNVLCRVARVGWVRSGHYPEKSLREACRGVAHESEGGSCPSELHQFHGPHPYPRCLRASSVYPPVTQAGALRRRQEIKSQGSLAPAKELALHYQPAQLSATIDRPWPE